jgi:kynurenine formamidase
MKDLPSYDELPPAAEGGRSGWGIFGEADSIGLMNLQTVDVVRQAAELVKDGKVFPLDVALNFFDPPLFERAVLRIETKVMREGRSLDEVYQDFNPQSASQWDSLAHVGYGIDQFYNGATLDDVLSGGRNTIDHWGRKGIVGRGVLLDLQGTADEQGRPYSPGSSHAFSVEDLEEARKAAGVTFRPGDVIVLRTGFPAWYKSLPQSEKDKLAQRANMTACGIEHTEDMVRYLWDSHASAVASDCPSLEVWPMDYSDEGAPFGTLHRHLIGQLGLAIGELWWLDDLAESCKEDGRYEFMIASAPFNSPGGVGSTANALAIK